MFRKCLRVILSFCLVLAAVAGGVARASEVPDPNWSSVQPFDGINGVIVCPGGIPATTVTVTVVDSGNNPMPNAEVEFLFLPQILICPDAVLTGLTDLNGQVTLVLEAGGCVRDTHNACLVKANGVIIREYHQVKSPDFDGAGPNHQVNLADLVAYGSGDLCHDYNNDAIVNLSDLVIFASGFSPSHSCP